MASPATLLDLALTGNVSSLREKLAAGLPDGMDLATAAALGDVATVRSLLSAEPARVTEPTGPRVWPPLLYVCFSCAYRVDAARADGLLRTADLLLERGADPNAFYVPEDRSPDSKHPALYGACGPNNYPALAKRLLEAGADPNDDESLYHATEHRDHACLDVLLDHGAVAGNLELHHMLDYQDHEGARKLLERGGADPNVTHIHTGETALHWAVNSRCAPETISLLLQHGAAPNAARGDGKTAYALACHLGEEAIAEVLRKSGASETLSAADRFLYACARADGDEARQLLTDDPDLLSTLPEDDKGMISRLAAGGRLDAVLLMLDLGIDIATMGDGFTALHQAAGNGNVALTEALLARGAPLEILSDYEGTVLDHTVYNAVHFANPDGDYPTVVARLIEAGASLAPLSRPSGHDAIDAILRQHGAFT